MSLNGVSSVSANHILADAITQAQGRREQRQQKIMSLIVTQAFELGKIHHKLSLEKTRLSKETIDLKHHLKELKISHPAEILAKGEMIEIKLQEIRKIYANFQKSLRDVGDLFTSHLGPDGPEKYTFNIKREPYSCILTDFRWVESEMTADYHLRMRWIWWRGIQKDALRHFLLDDPTDQPPLASEPSSSGLISRTVQETSLPECPQAVALPELLRPIAQQIKSLQADILILKEKTVALNMKISQLNEQHVRRIDRSVHYFNYLYDQLQPLEERITLAKSKGFRCYNCEGKQWTSLYGYVKRLDNSIGCSTLRFYVGDYCGVEYPERSNHSDKDAILKAAAIYYSYFDVLSSQFFAIVDKIKALRI